VQDTQVDKDKDHIGGAERIARRIGSGPLDHLGIWTIGPQGTNRGPDHWTTGDHIGGAERRAQTVSRRLHRAESDTHINAMIYP
jgi:hypothetical protein